MIIDTDVLIGYLRGNLRAKAVVEEHIPFSISAVTCMELIQGMRDKAEFRKFQRQMKFWKVQVIQIDPEISSRAIFYVQEYFLSHSMQMADALIAATAIQSGDSLLTANNKHYKHIPNIEVKRFVPGGRA